MARIRLSVPGEKFTHIFGTLVEVRWVHRGACLSKKIDFLVCLKQFLGALVALMDTKNVADTKSWHAVAPAHYFTAHNARFQPEDHAAVTHEFDKLRLVVVPEIPDAPLHVQKERLEGTSHAAPAPPPGNRVDRVDRVWRPKKHRKTAYILTNTVHFFEAFQCFLILMPKASKK